MNPASRTVASDATSDAAISRDYNIQQAIHTPLLGFDIVSCFLLLMVVVVVVVGVIYIYVYKWAGTCMHIMMRCP